MVTAGFALKLSRAPFLIQAGCTMLPQRLGIDGLEERHNQLLRVLSTQTSTDFLSKPWKIPAKLCVQQDTSFLNEPLSVSLSAKFELRFHRHGRRSFTDFPDALRFVCRARDAFYACLYYPCPSVFNPWPDIFWLNGKRNKPGNFRFPAQFLPTANESRTAQTLAAVDTLETSPVAHGKVPANGTRRRIFHEVGNGVAQGCNRPSVD